MRSCLDAEHRDSLLGYKAARSCCCPTVLQMSFGSTAAHIHNFILNLSNLTGDPTIPSQQILLLTALYVNGTMNQGDLEQVTGVRRSSNSRNIAKLGLGEHPLRKPGPGYVESFEDPGNRRLKLVRLTKKGRDLMDRALSGPGYFQQVGAPISKPQGIRASLT